MVPRWLIGVLVVVVLIWLWVNPAGLADFVVTVATNIGTFFEGLGK